MKFLKLALSLTIGSSLLVACGGGGGARSPDRLGTSLNKETLHIVFQPTSARRNTGTLEVPHAELLGSGNNSISAQLLGLQTDGVNMAITPELNVTRSATWSISGVGNPAIAKLGDGVRDAATIGDVKDIISSVRLFTDEPEVEATVTAVFQNVTRTGKVFILPPIAAGNPFISGVNIIPINPAVPSETFSTVYQLLQPLQNSSTRENRTNLVKFCSTNSFAVFSEPQPPTSGTAPIVFSNPFNPATETPSPVAFDIYTIDPADDCSDAAAPRIATLPVQIIPAQVTAIDICAVTNPQSDACGTNGVDFKTEYVSQCRGLGLDTLKVPAAQTLQMVAKLTYANPNNASQPTFEKFQCTSQGSLAWDSTPDTIYSIPLDQTGGDATFISRQAYLDLKDAGTATTSDVTGTYTYLSQDANASTPTSNVVSDGLQLELVDAKVDNLTIVRTDGLNPPEGDSIPLTGFGVTSIEYRALCAFNDFGTTTAPVQCPDTFVNWTLDPNTILEAEPDTLSATTTVSELTGRVPGTFGNVTLRAAYVDGISNLAATRVIKTFEDELIELHLFQSESGSDPMADPFSCVGRQDTVGTLQDGTNYAPSQQQFFAFGVFESAPTVEVDLTDNDGIYFLAERGYADGNGGCLTSADPTGSLPSPSDAPIPGLDQFPDSGDAASFSSDNKGQLNSNGTLRLSTVCVRTFADNDGDTVLSEGDTTGIESSTVLVLPVADDDLLTFSSELCGILEPVLTLGAGLGPNGELPAGAILPLVYGISLVADPVLGSLDGAVPTDAIITGLLSGDFSGLNPDAPASPFGGLGVITSAALGEDGLGPVVDALDACLLDPTTTAVTGFLTALLTANPDALSAPEFQSPECQAVIGDIGGGGGGDPTGDLGPLTDLLNTLSEQSPVSLTDLIDMLTGGLGG